MRKTHKKVTMLKGEKFMYILILIALVLFPIGTVYTKAVFSEHNIFLEQMRSKIETQEGINESLSMQVDELASLDKIQEVASSQGLTYNNDNIKNVE